MTAESKSSKCLELAKLIVKYGYETVLFDMDRTVMMEHSGGILDGEKERKTYIPSMTPTAKEFIPACLSVGLKVVIVSNIDALYTFASPQTSFSGDALIAEVFKVNLPNVDYSKIHVICFNPDLHVCSNNNKLTPALIAKSPVSGDTPEAYYKRWIAPFIEMANKRAPKESKWAELAKYPPSQFKLTHSDITQAITGTEFKKMMMFDDSSDNINACRRKGIFCVDVNKLSNYHGLAEGHITSTIARLSS